MNISKNLVNILGSLIGWIIIICIFITMVLVRVGWQGLLR